MGRLSVTQKQRARSLRRAQTDVEHRLWYSLRNRQQVGGFKFRRQYPIEPYVADFVCVCGPKAHHRARRRPTWGAADYDKRRSDFMQVRGFRVLRFWNNDVLNNFDGMLEAIRVALVQDPSP